MDLDGNEQGRPEVEDSQGGKHPPEIVGRRPRHVQMVGGGGTVKVASRRAKGMWVTVGSIWIWGSGE